MGRIFNILSLWHVIICFPLIYEQMDLLFHLHSVLFRFWSPNGEKGKSILFLLAHIHDLQKPFPSEK